MSDAPATKARTAMASITFTPSGETIDVPLGTSLLDAVILCELDVPAPCAGQGRCGRCRVRVRAGEVERRSNAGLVTAEILDGWAAGKFDAEKIAKTVKDSGIESRISHKKLVIPGHVAGLSGELEDELPGWQIMVGPRDAVDIPNYLKNVWGA